jgi:hypothetical protein
VTKEQVVLCHTYRQNRVIQGVSDSIFNKYGGRSTPSKCCIQKLVKKLEIMGSLKYQHARGCKLADQMIRDVKEWLLASLSKSLCGLSLEILYNVSTSCQESETATLLCVSGSRVTSGGQEKIYALLCMDAVSLELKYATTILDHYQCINSGFTAVSLWPLVRGPPCQWFRRIYEVVTAYLKVLYLTYAWRQSGGRTMSTPASSSIKFIFSMFNDTISTEEVTQYQISNDTMV